jgi:uncharacterized SAM-binding protein YcdF (DUF218 family)
MLKWISYSSLVPPNLFLLLALIGVVVAWRWRRGGLALATAAVVFLYLAALPITSFWLVGTADRLAGLVPRMPSLGPPGAIVVLSAEFRHGNVPGGRDIVGPLTLERLAEAARIERKTGLPILASGGWLIGSDDSLAGMMAQSLESDFHVPVKWREERSRTTYENARYSAEILRQAGVSSALVVTNPWHMARALWSFYAVGFPAVAAPLPEGLAPETDASLFFPQVPSLQRSYYALHEIIGLGWYILCAKLGLRP